MTASRVGPLTGVLSVVLFIVAFSISGDTPDFDASGEEVASFYEDNEGSQLIGAALIAYAALLFVFFAGSLRQALRRAEQDPGVLSAVVLASAAIFAVGVGIFSGITFTVVSAADEPEIEGGALQVLNMLGQDMFVPLAIGTAGFFWSSGLAIIRTGALPKWLGWVAVVLGVASLTPAGFFAFVALGLWTLVASFLLYQRAGREPGVGAAAGP
jgi:hypothetical protein